MGGNDFAKYLSSTLALRAQPILLVLLGGLSLEPKSLGQALQIYLLSTLLVPFMNFGFSLLISSFPSKTREGIHTRIAILKIQIYLVVLFCLGIVAVYLSIHDNLAISIWFALAVIALAGSGSLLLTLNAYVIGEGKYNSVMFSGFTFLLANTIGIYLLGRSNGVFGFILSILLGNILAIFSLVFGMSVKEIKLHKFKKGEVIWTVKSASPLMIHNLTSTIQTNFDRVFLSLFIASATFSEYLTSVIWGGSAGIVLEIVYTFWATRILSKDLSGQDFNIELSRFRKSFTTLTFQLSGLILIIGYLGLEIFGIVELEAKIAFTCIVGTVLIRIVFFLNLVVALKNGKAVNVGKATVLGSCVMVLTSIVFIPIFGFYGGVITTVVSFMVQSYSLSYFNRDRLFKVNLLLFLPSFVCFVTLGVILMNLENPFFEYFALLFVGGLTFFIIKNDLISGAFKKE
jgi:O-antigen/teichoic acid export membrane protein